MKPKITVITPTYNRANLLTQTIDSVLCQTLEDFEYYIIDDGSSDNTREIVAPYLSDTRVRYVYQDNAGEPAAVNQGWKLARGEYFVQVNSDDPAYPGLFEEMSKAMDENPEVIVAYCDFHFIDDAGAVIHTTRSVDWDFHRNLSLFSCVAAAPGTFFRRTGPLANWQALRRNNFKHINDVEMYWDMAIEGDFLHVPKVLATWREHSGQISYARYEAVEEIRRWFYYYFGKPGLREDILACREACKKSIVAYSVSLISQSSLCEDEKKRRVFDIRRDYFLDGYDFSCLQVGDNDLIGNKFNGHDLHLLLEERGVNAWHIVRNKESDDERTVAIAYSPYSDFSRQILRKPEFLFSDIVHLHLIHNTDFDLNMLPFMTRLKPTVITLHDPFFFSGHCVYHFDCGKWQTHCGDCPYPDIHFPLSEDDSAVRFAIKERAFQDADISVIVASDWMKEKAEKSPVFFGKKIYKLPFGIDQELFTPADPRQARRELGIPEDDVVLFFRFDSNEFKGTKTIVDTLRRLSREPLCAMLLVVGQTGLLAEFEDRFNLMEFGWIKSDELLATLYQASDLFLMPSDQEAFGMMAVEAMSCGKTVLAVPGTSLESVIDAPRCGVVASKEDYADTLLTLLRDRAALAERGARCLRYAKKHYSLARYTDGMLRIYRDVMDRFEAPDRSALILSSIPMMREVTHTFTLCHSLSWRMTKPLRAFSELLKALKQGPVKAVKHAVSYLKNEESPPDVVVPQTTSWKITAPLRAIRGLFAREGDRAYGEQR